MSTARNRPRASLTRVRHGSDDEEVDVGLLGPVRVAGLDGSLGPRDRVVLSVLALRPGEEVSAERIADALWRQEPPATWSKIVQGCVARLRRSLGQGAITTTPRGYRLEPAEVRVDSAEFERLVASGRDALAAGDHASAVSALQSAVALWRGLPFTELEEWPPGRNEAARMNELRLVAEEDLVEAALHGRDPGGVVPQAKLLVAEQPLREHRWALLARAQYLAEQQAEALDSIRQARRMLADELGLDPGEELTALEAAILAREPSLSRPAAVHSTVCPYKGLPSYDETDRELFFGRDDEVAACLSRLEGSPLLVLVGPSGCGKSSLMRAGIAPALAERGRPTALFTPGADPEAALAAARARTSGQPVLLVDQFEESFTLTPPERQRPWLARLADYAGSQAPVVLTVRADHVGALGSDPGFAALVEQGLHLVPPLTGDNLRAAVEMPARRAGLEVEPGLVDLVERDVEDEPGALPLMSHALAQTWAHRTGNRLTVAGYREAGGIRGAVAQSADRLYEVLGADERHLLRGILLRLVVANEDGDAVPTRYPARVLQADPARARLVEVLVQARLVTAEDGTLEIAHEALARAWPRLRSWLDEDAEGQRIRAHLASAAPGWEALGRDPGELYQGARLAAAVEWAASEEHDLTPLETEFLEASVAREASERLALEQRAHYQARQNRRLRVLLTGAVALALVAAGAGAVALRSSRAADQERDRAAAAESTARHEALVNRSLSLRNTNRSAAALLAVEAYLEQHDAQARSALLGTFTAAEAQGFLGYQYLYGARWVNGALIPGTDHAVLAVNGRYLRIVDRDLAELPDRFPSTPENAGGFSLLRVSADGRWLAQLQDTWVEDPQAPCGDVLVFGYVRGGRCTHLMVYDLDREGALRLGPFHAPFVGTDAALNHDGSLLAVTGGPRGDLAVYRVPSGRLVGRVAGHQRVDLSDYLRNISTVVFDAQDRVYVGSTAGDVRVFDGRTMRPLERYEVPPMSTNSRLVLTRDGVLVAGGSDAIAAVDTGSGALVWSIGLRATRSGSCPFLAVAESVGRLYCGNFYGQIAERELATGELTGRALDPQLGSVGNLEVTDDGTELVTFNDSGPVVSRWRLDGSGPVSRPIARGKVLVGGFDPLNRRLLVADPDDLGRVQVWDVDQDRAVRTVRAPEGATWVTPDLLAVFGRPPGTALLDVRTGEAPTDGRHPIDPGTAAVFPDYRSGTYFTVSAAPGPTPHPWVVRQVDARTGVVTALVDTVPAYEVNSVSSTPDGSRILVTSTGAEVLESSVYDGDTGKRLISGLPFQVRTVIGPDGEVVGASPTGPITQFDLETLRDVAQFPGSKGEVTSLQFSDDGRTLMVTAADQTVQLYDVKQRIRLGDPLLSQGSGLLVQAYLRDDGSQVAMSTAQGVSVWDIDSSTLARRACDLAGRNLTLLEQTTYLGELDYLGRTCWAHPRNTD